MMGLPGRLPIRQVTLKIYLPDVKIYLSPDDRMGLLSSPAQVKFTVS